MLAAARSAPDTTAVLERAPDGGLRAVTYRELDDLVQRYADALEELELDVGERVVLESDTSAEAVAMLLACSLLGLAFIPVSPQTPTPRLLTVVESAEPALHLQTVTGGRTGLPDNLGTARFGPGGIQVEQPVTRRGRLRREVTATDTAYIIFTSGTTGRPKGVVMSHRSVVAFFRAILRRELVTADDRIASTSPLQFDFALFDIGLALGSGATLVPVPRPVLNWPRRLVSFLDDTGATRVDGVPSIWRPVLRHEPEALAGLHRLRGVLFAGEDFPLPELRTLQRLLPRVRVVNGYGATESMACSFTDVPHPLPDDLERLSIGTALPGSEAILLDEHRNPVDKAGVVGEIFLRSPSLFSGYWGDPQATAVTLVPDPLQPRSGQSVLRTGDLAYRGEDGEMYFCGRVDSQVQVRGNRVELVEIERRLLSHPAVAAAVVLLLPVPGGDPQLTAFTVPGPAPTPGDAAGADESVCDKKQLRAFCAQTLPDYMVPQEICVIDDIPVTEHGKVDRSLLAARAAAGRTTGVRG